MKKIYTLFAVSALVLGANAQNSAGKAIPIASKPLVRSTSADRMTSPDTTGLVNFTDFMPQFAAISNSYTIYGYTGGGYIFGNNVDGLNINAQGYQNLGPIPVKVIGVIAQFARLQSDLGSSASSKVVFTGYDVKPNKSYNTDGSGTFNQTTLNFAGPSGTAKCSADLLFSSIDTTLSWNYVPFTSPATFVGDFAIVMDASSANLAAGDTVGLLSDSQNDAQNLDYAFSKFGTKWFVTDQMYSDPTTGGSLDLDNDLALFAVVADATGINEFFNGMKLTAYPNPAVNNVTVEYTLEKDANAVFLTVFDNSGKKVSENKLNSQSAGKHFVNIDASNLAAGTYFYKLNAGGHNFTKQLVITK
jgi:hypothetical protein